MLDYLIVFLIMIVFVKENSRRAYKFSIILGIIMIINLVLYSILIELIKFRFEPFNGFKPETDVVMLRYALIGAAIITSLLIALMRRLFIRALFRGDQSIKNINGLLVLSSQMTYCLCEAIAIYGLLLFLYAGSSLDFYLFLVLCLVLLGIYFPRYSNWEVWIRQVEERVTETY